MAKASGFGRTMLQQIWRAFGLQPPRTETLNVSTDPLVVEKVRDIVGLYMQPPTRAVVFCVDEKSQIQAVGPQAIRVVRSSDRSNGAPTTIVGMVLRRCLRRST